MRLRMEGDRVARVAAILINVAEMQACTDPGEPWGHLHLATQAQLFYKGHVYLFDHVDAIQASLQSLRTTPTPQQLEIIGYLESWLRIYADAASKTAEVIDRVSRGV